MAGAGVGNENIVENKKNYVLTQLQHWQRRQVTTIMMESFMKWEAKGLIKGLERYFKCYWICLYWYLFRNLFRTQLFIAFIKISLEILGNCWRVGKWAEQVGDLCTAVSWPSSLPHCLRRALGLPAPSLKGLCDMVHTNAYKALTSSLSSSEKWICWEAQPPSVSTLNNLIRVITTF